MTRRGWLVSTVIAVHVAAVGAFLLIQGCRTTAPVPPPEVPVMPPVATTPEPAPAPAPLVVPPPPVQMLPPEPMAPVTTAPKADVPPAKKWQSQTTTYVVQKGDTLSDIAYKYDLTVSEISALNKITNPARISVGQKILLPGTIDLSKAKKVAKPKKVSKPKKEAVTTKDTSAAPAGAAAAVAGAGEYVIQPGDTLSELAVKFGTKTEEIRKANNLKNDRITAGQKITIPGGATAKPDAAAAPAVDVPAIPASTMGESSSATAEAPAAVAATPAPAAAPEKNVPVWPHTVEEGQDLNQIAIMYGVSVAALREFNKLDQDAVKPGQVLNIPMSE